MTPARDGREAGGESPWPAPAKINRFLQITGRRADGYHTLQTLFQFLDYHDDIHLRVRADGAIRRPAPLPGIAEADDLAVRAARALQVETGAAAGAEIRITKRLPAGGGLGGGSSDAATVLVALNHLWGCALADDDLAAIGLTLGADVPVFVHGRAAWAEGVGEVLTPLRPDRPWFVVLAPACAVSTKALFQAPELTRNSPPITIRDFRRGGGRNDFEPVVRARYPEVARAMEALAPFGTPRLSGSGGCVFAACSEQATARDALAACQAQGWHGFMARGRNRSPLRDRLLAATSGR